MMISKDIKETRKPIPNFTSTKLQSLNQFLKQLNRVFVNSTTKIDLPSSDLKVGHIIEVHANQRIPADLLLLYTSYNHYNNNKGL